MAFEDFACLRPQVAACITTSAIAKTSANSSSYTAIMIMVAQGNPPYFKTWSLAVRKTNFRCRILVIAIGWISFFRYSHRTGYPSFAPACVGLRFAGLMS